MCKTKCPLSQFILTEQQIVVSWAHDVASFVYPCFFSVCHTETAVCFHAFLVRALWQIFIREIILTRRVTVYTNSIAMDHLCIPIFGFRGVENTLEKKVEITIWISEQMKKTKKCMDFMLKANIFQFLFGFTLKFSKINYAIANPKRKQHFWFTFQIFQNWTNKNVKKEKIIINGRKFGSKS